MSTQPDSLDAPCPVGPGEVLSQRYALELLIGEGSFGWVFSALELTHAARRVALKVLRPSASLAKDSSRRLEERELALLLRVQHHQTTPHVVRVLEATVQRHGPLSYLVLEFIDGPSLREVLDRGAVLGVEPIRRLGAGLAEGLAAIHAAGGVHRDLKPTNIRLRGGEAPVIVDFGTALTLWEPSELTAPGQRAPLTPRYASPEQLAGHPGTPASDVYAWGVILQELLSRLPPASTPGERAALSLLREWVRASLDHAPERRPSARELLQALSAPVAPRERALGRR